MKSKKISIFSIEAFKPFIVFIYVNFDILLSKRCSLIRAFSEAENFSILSRILYSFILLQYWQVGRG